MDDNPRLARLQREKARLERWLDRRGWPWHRGMSLQLDAVIVELEKRS